MEKELRVPLTAAWPRVQPPLFIRRRLAKMNSPANLWAGGHETQH